MERSIANRASLIASYLLILFTPFILRAQDPDLPALIGRWDVTVHQPGKEVPSWLEVSHSGRSTLVGRWVGGGGSARPISKVYFDGGKFHFAIPPQWEPQDRDLSVEGTLQGDKLSGTLVMPDGQQYSWSGVRAPTLGRAKKPVWGMPILLFNGTTLAGWHPLGQKNQWQAAGGVLRSPASGSNIATDRTFTDFKLHIEFRCPKGSNSGVYLRGRYEVQIEDSNKEPRGNELSAIYGFLPPNVMAAKPGGEWQSFDITLVGRLVTVVLNGTTVICNTEIPGITGGALDSKEGEPGPIYLQGDHGPIEYRNITITPAK